MIRLCTWVPADVTPPPPLPLPSPPALPPPPPPPEECYKIVPAWGPRPLDPCAAEVTGGAQPTTMTRHYKDRSHAVLQTAVVPSEHDLSADEPRQAVRRDGEDMNHGAPAHKRLQPDFFWSTAVQHLKTIESLSATNAELVADNDRLLGRVAKLEAEVSKAQAESEAAAVDDADWRRQVKQLLGSQASVLKDLTSAL